MKTMFGIFWHDVRQLVRSPLVLLVVLLLMVLSSAYAWYSISTLWNPYSNASDLKVAVVNEDAGVDLGDEEYASLPEAQGEARLDIGAMLIEGLQDDDSFDWRFVDANEAAAGLESGDYYAEFVIPERFTADFLSVLTDEREHPSIEYWVSEKRNVASLKVTDSGASVLDSLVSRAFSDVLSETTADVVKGTSASAVKVPATTRSGSQLNLNIATSNVAEAAGKLALVEKSIDRWVSSASSAKGSLDSLKSGLPGLRTAVNGAITQLEDAQAAMHDAERAYSGSLTTTSEALPKAMKSASGSIKGIASDIGKKQGELDASTGRARQALKAMRDVIAALDKIGIDSDALADLEQEVEALSTELDKTDDAVDALGDAATEAAAAVEEAAADIDEAVKNLQSGDDEPDDGILSTLDSSMDSIALVLGSLDNATETLYGRVDQAKALLDGLDGALGQAKGTVMGVESILGAAGEELRSTRTSLASIADSDFMAHVSKLVDIDAKSYGSFMASPVSADVQPIYAPVSYGAAVAPFFTVVALWAGCLVLVMVLKVDTGSQLFPRARPWQRYAGRLMLFILLAFLQGVIVSVGDIMLGVQPVAPVSFVLASVLASLCFASVVYALAFTFRHVGKALAVVLLVVQICLAAGWYPIQLMPESFQALFAWAPFTYGIGALREPLAGFYGVAYARDLLWLLACGAVSSVLALLVRSPLTNVNGALGRKLRFADVFVIEDADAAAVDTDRRPAVNVLLGREDIRDELIADMQAFSARYTVIKQLVPVVVIVLVLGFAATGFLLNPAPDGMLGMLAVFTAALVVVFCVGVATESRLDGLVSDLRAMGIDIDEMHVDRVRAVPLKEAGDDVRRVGSGGRVEAVAEDGFELVAKAGSASAADEGGPESAADMSEFEAEAAVAAEAAVEGSVVIVGEFEPDESPAREGDGWAERDLQDGFPYWANDAWGLDAWEVGLVDGGEADGEGAVDVDDEGAVDALAGGFADADVDDGNGANTGVYEDEGRGDE